MTMHVTCCSQSSSLLFALMIHCLQVGRWNCQDRLKFLEKNYYFRCQCRSCSVVNLSDLVLSAFHCVHPHCSGIVLDTFDVKSESEKLEQSRHAVDLYSLEPYLQVSKIILS